jgi:UDP-glucose 4-epimerase
MLHALEHASARINLFNLGHYEVLNVLAVANIVCRELGLSGVTYKLSGGERGWKGDAPFVLLDTARIKALGWQPATPIEEGIRRTVRHLIAHPELLRRP